LLQALEDARMIARRRPKIPRHHAGRMPDGIPVRAAIPKVDVPAEPVDRLAADAAESRPAGVAPLAIGRWRSPETCRQPIRLAIIRLAPCRVRRLFVGEPPTPTRRGGAGPPKGGRGTNC